MSALRVGLTGGIGSGKSEVGKIFADLGAFLIDADVVAREVTAPGTQAAAEILARWPQAKAPDGTLDRQALAAIIFAHPAEREALNAIVHPEVRRRMREMEDEHLLQQFSESDERPSAGPQVAKSPPESAVSTPGVGESSLAPTFHNAALIVHEVPLLFENGLYREMDVNVLVTAPEEERIARLIARNHWSREQILARMATQILPEKARALADHIIENNGNLAELRSKIQTSYEILQRLTKGTG